MWIVVSCHSSCTLLEEVVSSMCLSVYLLIAGRLFVYIPSQSKPVLEPDDVDIYEIAVYSNFLK